MLLQAIEVNYDYVNKRVSAVGSVQIYHSGSTLEADRVIYDETTKRLHAEGNVRLTDANGQITYGEMMNLSDDFRDGFVDSLRRRTLPSRPGWRRRAPTAAAASSRCSRAASTPPASRARTIRESRRCGRSRRRGSSTTPARR